MKNKKLQIVMEAIAKEEFRIVAGRTPETRIVAMARAAIESLREPSQAMVAAACDDYDKRKGRQSYTDVWQAMIDEILK